MNTQRQQTIRKPSVPIDDTLWNIEEVKKHIGWKAASSVYRAIEKLGFPKPVKIGLRKSMWRKSAVLDWVDAQELKAVEA